MSEPQRRVGIALGGGGARGLAHVAVLKVLRENDIPIHCVAGSSVGALIASLYCAGTSFDAIEEVAKTVRWKDLGSLSLRLRGLQSNARMDGFLRKLMPETSFDRMKTPLSIVATDLIKAVPVVIQSGDVPLAVRASTAIPGVYAPVEWEGHTLVDGAIMTHVPVRACREMGADVVIAVDVGGNPALKRRPRNIYSIILQVYSIMQHNQGRGQLAEADVLIRPEMDGIGWDELERNQEILLAGKKAAMAQLEAVHLAVSGPGWVQRFKDMLRGGGR